MRKDPIFDIELADAGDAVCLIQDGVYLSRQGPTELERTVTAARAAGVKFYVLVEDCEARGISPGSAFLPVTYDGLAGLISEYKRIIA